jgi:hypothetical protein
MLTTHLSLVFWMVVVLVVSSVLASALGLGLAPVLAKVTTIPSRLLVPFVLTLATIGAYASTGLMLQVAMMMALGVVGLLMRRYNYSLPAVIVGLVLGVTAENNLDLTVQLFSWRFVERPLSDVLLAVILAVIALGYRNRSGRRASRVAAATQPGEETAGGAQGEPATAKRQRRPATVRSAGELVVDILWVIGTALYVNAARHYPSPADIGPTFLGLAALVVALTQLVGGFFPGFRRITVGSQDALIDAGVASVTQPAAASAAGPSPVLDVMEDAVPSGAAVGVPKPAAAVHAGAADGTDQRVVGESPDFGGSHPDGMALPGRPARTVTSPAYGDQIGWGARLTLQAGKVRILGEAGHQALCVVMGALLVAGIYLVGFTIAVPAFVLLYLAGVYRWRWWKAVIATAIMVGAAVLLPYALSMHFPSPLL